MVPKMVPEFIKNVIFWGIHFLSLFLKVLELFWCLLGAFLGLPRLSWKALDPKNIEKLKMFLRFLQLQVFGALRLLMGLLGPSWPILGRSGPKVPKMDPKVFQKVPQK